MAEHGISAEKRPAEVVEENQEIQADDDNRLPGVCTVLNTATIVESKKDGMRIREEEEAVRGSAGTYEVHDRGL